MQPFEDVDKFSIYNCNDIYIIMELILGGPYVKFTPFKIVNICTDRINYVGMQCQNIDFKLDRIIGTDKENIPTQCDYKYFFLQGKLTKEMEETFQNKKYMKYDFNTYIFKLQNKVFIKDILRKIYGRYGDNDFELKTAFRYKAQYRNAIKELKKLDTDKLQEWQTKIQPTDCQQKNSSTPICST